MPYYDMAESLRETDFLQHIIASLEKRPEYREATSSQDVLMKEVARIKAAARKDILIFGKHAEIYIAVQTRLILNLDIQLIDFLKTLKARYSLAYQQRRLVLACELLHEELLRLVCFYEQLIDMMIL